MGILCRNKLGSVVPAYATHGTHQIYRIYRIYIDLESPDETEAFIDLNKNKMRSNVSRGAQGT